MAEYIIPIVATVATVASTAYSVYSSVEAGHEARQARHEAEGLAIERARLEAESERAAEEATRLQAQRDVKAEQDRRRRILATQSALYGAAGLEMEGSPLLVKAESIRQSEENISQIEENLGQALRVSSIGNRGTALSLYEQGIERDRYYSAAEDRATYSAIESGMKGLNTGIGIGRTYQWWK